MTVHDYRAAYNDDWGYGTADLNVLGTFTPVGDYFHGPTMQDGSTIDLSGRTGAWSSTSLITTGCNRTTKFADGATVRVELGQRRVRVGDKIISWASAPSNVTFRGRNCVFEVRQDGLYVAGRVDATVLFVQ